MQSNEPQAGKSKNDFACKFKQLSNNYQIERYWIVDFQVIEIMSNDSPKIRYQIMDF